jgi:structural maintenance of chromosome 4
VDDFLLVPNSQLIVTRTAFRNNSSKYTINDRSSSFTEVTTLLKGKGIDLDHNRFLILQGEVESIALMKAKAQNEHEDGLLEYLEDIIGTTQYKTPIEAANLEVEQLNEDRAEKMSRLRVVEREKAALEDKKREAESFLRDTNELTRKKSLLWQFHMHTLNGNIEITTKSIDKLNGTLVEEQERNAHHLAEIENLQKGYEAKLADYDEVKRLTDTLVKDAKKIEKDEVGLQEKKKHLVSKQKKLKKSISDDGHVKSGALSSVSNCAEAIETNRTKVTELESKLEAEEAELEEIRDSLKGELASRTRVLTLQIKPTSLLPRLRPSSASSSRGLPRLATSSQPWMSPSLSATSLLKKLRLPSLPSRRPRPRSRACANQTRASRKNTRRSRKSMPRRRNTSPRPRPSFRWVFSLVIANPADT